MPRLKFRPGLVPTIAVLIGLAILLKLGFWQVSRYQEKQRLIAEATRRHAQPPVTLAEALATPEPHEWRRVIARGVYVPRETVLLLARRDGRTGSRVLTPLRVEGLLESGEECAQHRAYAAPVGVLDDVGGGKGGLGTGLLGHPV